MASDHPFQPDFVSPQLCALCPTLEDQIEAIQSRLARLIARAESADDWAEITDIEAKELAPLLRIKLDMRRRTDA